MRKNPVPDDEIDLPFDGFPSQRDRDIALNKARKHLNSKHFKTVDKLKRAIQIEQGNTTNLEENVKKDRELYTKRVIELISDIRDLIAIIMKHPEMVDMEDMRLITELKEKMIKAQDEEDL